MPKVRRSNLPRGVIFHLLDRIREREISKSQLRLFSEWLDTEPEVSHGKWFKRFPGMIACGEDGLVKTFLRPGQSPAGIEIR